MSDKDESKYQKKGVNIPNVLWEKIQKEMDETGKNYTQIIIEALNIKYEKEELMGQLDELLSRSLKGERTILDEWFDRKFNQRLKKLKVDVSTESK